MIGSAPGTGPPFFPCDLLHAARSPSIVRIGKSGVADWQRLPVPERKAMPRHSMGYRVLRVWNVCGMQGLSPESLECCQWLGS